MSFSFGFAGDDIDTSNEVETKPAAPTQTPAAGAFPVPGKPQLSPTQHDIQSLLSRLPSKIAYGLLEVVFDDGTKVHLPRRELWDVRVQLMAEEEGAGDVNGDGSGLGTHDVKTGVYEGGFKSWESSVDLVKTIASEKYLSNADTVATRIIELGCGTALPAVSLFQLAMKTPALKPSHFILADYNPTVLQLVTVPNLVLAWALHHQQTTPALQEAFTIEGELEIIPGVIEAFQEFLKQSDIKMTFLSGAWSQEFVDLLYSSNSLESPCQTIILGAETIYSPFALQAFTETVFSIFEREKANDAVALVGAKKLYFGVGGSLDDFVEEAGRRGGTVTNLREEADGVRRGVVRCSVDK